MIAKSIVLLFVAFTIINCCCWNDPLCAQYDSVGNCVTCSYRSYFKNGVCTAVSGQCNTYNSLNGNCLTCYSGFTLSNGACIISTAPTNNPLCAQFNAAGQCTQCSPRSYLASNGICVAVSTLCNTYSTINGNCLSCYAGYTLSNGACIISPPASNPYCTNFNSAGVCTACAPRTYLASNKICIQVSILCNTYSTINGNCLSCYPGYFLFFGACYPFAITPTNSITNPWCTHFNAAGYCTQCAPRYYFGPGGNCTAINPRCNTFDVYTGNCWSCYAGYTLSAGDCIVAPSPAISNPWCLQFNAAGQCILCASRTYFGPNGYCTFIQAACSNYNVYTGYCYLCYIGYTWSNGHCS